MLSDFQNLVTRKVRADTDDIASLDIADAIAEAVTRYSKDRPHDVVEDVTAPGGQLLGLPSQWVSGFSDIAQIEYPIGNVPPTLIDEHHVYQGPTGEMIMIANTLQDGEQVRISYHTFHALDETTDTIRRIHREAVAGYAAALLCDQLASLYAQDGTPTIQAASVDHGSKSDKFARRAKDLRKRYRDQVGVAETTNSAAGMVVDMDLKNSLGRDRLLKSNRYR